MNLLVVDDDSVIRMLMRTMLTAEGYGVVTASDGEEALLKLSESSFDMIITDVRMPRLDGIRLRNIVREMEGYAKMPILYISGYNDKLPVDLSQQPATEGFFRKGKPLTQLLALIKYFSTPEKKRPLSPPSFEGTPLPPTPVQPNQRGSARTSAM